MRVPTLSGARIDPDVRGGRPVVAGTEMPVSKLLAELAQRGCTPDELAEHYGLEPEAVRSALVWGSALLNQSYAEAP